MTSDLHRPIAQIRDGDANGFAALVEYQIPAGDVITSRRRFIGRIPEERQWRDRQKCTVQRKL